jgi:hypothetical protein
MIFEIFVAVSMKNVECCALYSGRDLPKFLLRKPASWIFKPEELYGEEVGVRFLRNVGKPVPEYTEPRATTSQDTVNSTNNWR